MTELFSYYYKLFIFKIHIIFDWKTIKNVCNLQQILPCWSHWDIFDSIRPWIKRTFWPFPRPFRSNAKVPVKHKQNPAAICTILCCATLSFFCCCHWALKIPKKCTFLHQKLILAIQVIVQAIIQFRCQSPKYETGF